MAENFNKTPLTNCKTPARRLGIRRSAQKAQSNQNTPVSAQRTPISYDDQPKPQPTLDCVPKTPVVQTPTLEKACKTAVKHTPKAENSHPARNCKSTGGVVKKYRLSLNEKIRDKYTRKRLNFAVQDVTHPIHVPEANNPECLSRVTGGSSTAYSTKPDSPPAFSEIGSANTTTTPTALPSNLISLPIEEQIIQLKKLLKDKRDRIVAMDRHETEVASLKSAISTWETGFRGALDELLSLVPTPKPSIEEILKQLGIPADLIDY